MKMVTSFVNGPLVDELQAPCEHLNVWCENHTSWRGDVGKEHGTVLHFRNMKWLRGEEGADGQTDGRTDRRRGHAEEMSRCPELTVCHRAF